MFARSTQQRQTVIAKATRGTEWGQFLRYLSPALLEVMPMSSLSAQGRELVANASNGKRFDDAASSTRQHLDELGRGVRLESTGQALRVDALEVSRRQEIGDRVLELYFAQLFWGETTILDLRASRFSAESSHRLDWFPRPFYLSWHPDFIAHVRDLYSGFYTDDDAAFARGVRGLNLGPAGDVLRNHFGGDDQRRVRFSSDVFHSTFGEAFTACCEHGLALHRNFIALGIYLACLYDVLETLDVELDVRGAFERVAKKER